MQIAPINHIPRFLPLICNTLQRPFQSTIPLPTTLNKRLIASPDRNNNTREENQQSTLCQKTTTQQSTCHQKTSKQHDLAMLERYDLFTKPLTHAKHNLHPTPVVTFIPLAFPASPSSPITIFLCPPTN